jgi:UDP-N-acetylglucosamine 2-epimerase (non-hydrolysing)/GDP/UDP-N,N'-diacetylbacillosamine 2-epimerase (hydrolysing)
MTERRRHIVAVSGSRADYGLLVWPMRRIAADPDLRLSILVTGMHLAPEFGLTAGLLVDDGFEIACRVPTVDPEDSA